MNSGKVQEAIVVIKRIEIDPSDVHPLPIRQYPNSRIVGDVPKNVYRKAHENGIR